MTTENAGNKYPDFIDDARLTALVRDTREDAGRVRDVIAKSMAKQPLTLEECAVLLAAGSPDLVEQIFAAARELKRTVYGNRIVLFAPLYIGNYCINNCAYCGFRTGATSALRKTLTNDELRLQVEALEDMGHKRLILVCGEHPTYTPQFIADAVRTVYGTHKGKGEIRRVNINAAPLEIEGYKIIKAAGIGTYQIFQETYHHETYRAMHPAHTRKGDYLYRLQGLTRAFEAGCDDLGIGALFGLYDWKFEVLGLVAHAAFLSQRFNCGPHTISFPRIQPAHDMHLDTKHFVSDADYKRLVAILRLAVPYTGLIMTARESAAIRNEVMAFGVSQIDAGTRIELGGYTRKGAQDLRREQFQIGDVRSLDEMARELMQAGYVPSFCTSCYRQGRTGEIFMEYAIPGFIQQFCTPNALVTLAEYLEDYASPATREIGRSLIAQELGKLEAPQAEAARTALAAVAQGKRDIIF